MNELSRLVDEGIKELEGQMHHRNADPTFIPVHLTGGIGDVIMAMDSIEYLASMQDIVVYTHHLEAFRYFNKDIAAFKVLPEFTWNLEFNTIAKFHFRQGFHGFANPAHNALFLFQQAAFDRDPDLETLVKTHFDKFYLISRYAEMRGLDRRQMALHTLGHRSKVPFVRSYSEKSKIITIHDGFDIHNRHIVTGRATKTWDWRHWNDLVFMLHKNYPDYMVIQLGASPTARTIDGVDRCAIDETTITEAFNIIKRSALHIDGDSGLVHAAARFSTPTISLWGPTPEKFYGYDFHKMIRSSACVGSCYGVKKNWNDKCVAGHANPVCMDTITPNIVMKEVADVLGESRVWSEMGRSNVCSTF